MTTPSLFMLAGEASGDALGAMVMDGLIADDQHFRCWGVGGEAMQARGFDSITPMQAFTVLGLGEALGAIPRLNRLANSLIERIMAERPAAVLTIDNKGFSMRFARRLKKRMVAAGWHAPVIHLVAPTVWAWGAWRARTVARSVDRLLCLFPFEARYFSPHGLAVTVVGHPAAERDRPSRAAARAALELEPSAKVIALLPGSRRREIRTLLPDMLSAAVMLRESEPGLVALLPVAGSVMAEVHGLASEAAGVRCLDQDQLDIALAAADAALICSGTVALEVALAGVPGAVYYRPDGLSRMIGNLLVDRSKVVLPNAIMGKEIYPLFLNSEFSAATMAATAGAALAGEIPAPAPGLQQQLVVEGGFGQAAARAIRASLAPS